MSFQAASAAQLVPGALLPVPSYPGSSPTAGPHPGAVVAVQPGPAGLHGVQQYVPVTMVEQGGRMLAVGAASWAAPSGRQMALVPSWQQLAPAHAAAGHGSAPQTGTLLVQAEDWRRPFIADNAQGIRIAQGTKYSCFMTT